MMSLRFRGLNLRQSGFTLIEVIIGIALVGLISLAIGLLMGMLFKVSSSSLHRATAIRQVQNVGMWISQDIQSAQYVQINTATGHLLEVTWADWSGSRYKVEYEYDTAITADLLRKYYTTTNGVFSNTPTSQMIVGHYIDHATTLILSAGVYKLTVTATISGLSANGQPVTETRVYEMIPRPGSNSH